MKNLLLAGLLTIAALAHSAVAQGNVYLVTVDTSSVNGQTGTIDLQFNAGMLNTQNACVTISNFSTDGALGSPSASAGNVRGTLATTLTINNGSGGCPTATTYTPSTFNDYNQPIKFGNTLSFFVVLSGPAVNYSANTNIVGNYNGDSGSSFGVAFTANGAPALTSDASNFAGTITQNPDGTVTTAGLAGPGGGASVVTIQLGGLVTVTTSPSGLSFAVDGTRYTSAQTFPWTFASHHTASTTSPQPGATGTKYVFNGWSDGTTSTTDTIGAAFFPATYTANFITEYLLTTAANPSADGSVSVTTTSPTGDGYYVSGTPVSITANPNTGYKFTKWTGNVASPNSATTTVTMSAPETVTAHFAVNNVSVTVGTSPSGLSFTVDSKNYTTTQTFAWQVASTHNVSTNSPQGLKGNEYSFSSWSGGNNPSSTSESITVGGAASYTANFNAMSELTFSPTSLYFTGRDVGTTSPAQTVTVTNKGSNAVTFSSVSSSSADFVVSNNGCTSQIAGNGGACQVQVQFKPTTYGSRTGTLAFTDTGANGTQSVALSGAGIGAQLSPSSLTFPAQHGNTQSATQTLTLTNFLSTALPYGAASFSGANPNDFPIQGGTCSTSGDTLAANGTAGSSCTYLIAFVPTVNGTESATLSVSAAGTQNHSLKGTGVGALLPPPTGYFPAQLGNTTSPTTITLTFYNYLSSPLGYTPTMTGPNAGDFIVQSSSTCANSKGAPVASSLAAKSSCTFVFKFHPTANGPESGTLSISDADGTQTSTLTGTGVGAQLAPSSYSFGTYPKGHSSAAKSFTLTNYLSSPLSITGTSFSGANSGDFSISGGTCPTTSGSLASNSSCTYNIVFKPSTTSSETATFTVTDADGSQSTALSGSGH